MKTVDLLCIPGFNFGHERQLAYEKLYAALKLLDYAYWETAQLDRDEMTAVLLGHHGFDQVEYLDTGKTAAEAIMLISRARRRVFIFERGSDETRDWAKNFKFRGQSAFEAAKALALQVGGTYPVAVEKFRVVDCGEIHDGFEDGASAIMLAAIRKARELNVEDYEWHFLGHSKGAGEAIDAAYLWMLLGRFPAEVITAAGPIATDTKAHSLFNNQAIERTFRFVNPGDFVSYLGLGQHVGRRFVLADEGVVERDYTGAEARKNLLTGLGNFAKLNFDWRVERHKLGTGYLPKVRKLMEAYA